MCYLEIVEARMIVHNIYIYQNSLVYGLLQENLLITRTPLMRHTCVMVTATDRGYPILS